MALSAHTRESAGGSARGKRLPAAQRHSRLLRYLHQKHFADVNELTSQLNVSVATIRRDLSELEKSGLLSRIHGGAVAAPQVTTDYDASIRETMNLEEKKRIAKAAAQLVVDDDTVMIDSGTTSRQVAEFLADNQTLTFVTNGIDVFLTLVAKGCYRIHFIGGEWVPINRSFGGNLAVETARKFTVDKAFLSVAAVDVKRGQICTLHPQIGCVQQMMIESANTVIVVADYSKFGRAALSVITSLNTIDYIVTDDKARPRIASLPEAVKRKFIIAEE
ncbi:MAG: DeoR/GlpR family DNA-binding transcription regulator [Methylobacteriaceae bacterium]|jgi:DeoR/GlpR family transcriptional regulator of sugar metabolism|nr:DeoR/GlpR family DNA-binding transcription regulator [Methylobacteriaceae bacterium]